MQAGVTTLLPRLPRSIATLGARPQYGRRVLRLGGNLIGAASAAVFAYSFLHFYVEFHRPIGIVFFAQQAIVAVAYVVRRPARSTTLRLDDWLLAFGGTFVGVLLRPEGFHPAWGIWSGTALQLIGAAIAMTCIVTLRRSFGFAAANRGIVTAGIYRVVRHPMYASYAVLETGYLLQSLSLRNGVIVAIGMLCNAGRALAEERLLAGDVEYRAYCRQVRRRIIPGLW